MISAILSFLGGSAFRMIWGEVSAFVTKRQDHQYELERMRMQADLEAERHLRQLESIRLQSELEIKVVQVKSEAAVDELETSAWLEAVKSTAKSVGVAWVDAWNAVIRPGLATWAIAMLTLNEFGAFVITEGTASVCYAALGIYLADRALGKRGK